MTDASLVAAFLLGLLGNVHCIAMCGGIAGALASPERASTAHERAGRGLATTLLTNSGRIASYALAGGLSGSVGWLLAESLGGSGALLLRGLFGLGIVAAGLALIGWNRITAALEALGQPVWRRLSRGVGRLRPADRAWKSLLLGAIWGWLPCGLVYAALMGAATSGSGFRGALFMTAFGVGTLPGLLAVGALAAKLRGVFANHSVRFAAGLTIAAFGLWTFAGALMSQGHAHSGSGVEQVTDAQPHDHSMH